MEVAFVNGFAPGRDSWITHCSIIKMHESVCVLTFIDVLGLRCRFSKDNICIVGYNDACITLYGDLSDLVVGSHHPLRIVSPSLHPVW